MKPREIRDLTVDELRSKAGELRKELFNLRMRHKTAQLENPIKLRTLRKDIARVLTIAAEKEKGAHNG